MSDDNATLDPSDISPVDIVDEMKASYLDYAMSVIVARALPDVRDGLKPVHRRILFASQEGGFVAGRPYRKSAKIVGVQLVGRERFDWVTDQGDLIVNGDAHAV